MKEKTVFTRDGVCGRAVTSLSCEDMIKIGRAMGIIYSNRTAGKAKIVICRDTRVSGEILAAAFTAGCCSAGADVLQAGILPTAAAPFLVRKYKADAAISVSAAHNSYEINGMKIFDGHGEAVPAEIFDEIKRIYYSEDGGLSQCTGGANIGKIIQAKDAEWDYVRALIKEVSGDLSKTRIVIDCANGAASTCAEKFFRGIGAQITLINNEPDGFNINKNCGVQDMSGLVSSVIKTRAHVGIALDGDGGRCLMVDKEGNILGGDSITVIISSDMKEKGTLSGNTVVVSPTVNWAFYKWSDAHEIVTMQTKEPGDAGIAERMKECSYTLGGSESGHILINGYVSDGMLTAGKVLDIMAHSHKELSKLVEDYKPYHMYTLNVPLLHEYCGRWDSVPKLKEMIDFCQKKLEGDGRIYVRESSASEILRITAEGRDEELIKQYAIAIARTAEECVGMEEAGQDENS